MKRKVVLTVTVDDGPEYANGATVSTDDLAQAGRALTLLVHGLKIKIQELVGADVFFISDVATLEEQFRAEQSQALKGSTNDTDTRQPVHGDRRHRPRI